MAMRLFEEAACRNPAAIAYPGFYVHMALRLVPPGYRTPAELAARLDRIAETEREILRLLFQSRTLPRAVARRKRAAWAGLMIGLAALYRTSGRPAAAASLLARALAIAPSAPFVAALTRMRRRAASHNQGGVRTSMPYSGAR
jgi:hypothetical protein